MAGSKSDKAAVIEDERNSATRSFLVQNVLTPVQGAVILLVEQWNKAVASVTEARLDLFKDLPQIGAPLFTLRESLDTSLAKDKSDAAFFASLARVYEAGRRMVAAIEETLQDPLAGASEAQAAALRVLMAQVQRVEAALADPREAAEKAVTDTRKAVLDAIAGTLALRLFFVLPATDRDDVAGAFDAAVRAALIDTLGHADSLDKLPSTFAAAIFQRANGPTQRLNDALRRAATEVASGSVLTRRLLAAQANTDLALTHWQTLQRALDGKDIPAGAQALTLLLGDVAGLTGSTIELPGLDDACNKLQAIPTLLKSAITVLVPAGDDGDADALDDLATRLRTSGSLLGTAALPAKTDPVTALAVLSSLEALLGGLQQLGNSILATEIAAARSKLVLPIARFAEACAGLLRRVAALGRASTGMLSPPVVQLSGSLIALVEVVSSVVFRLLVMQGERLCSCLVPIVPKYHPIAFDLTPTFKLSVV